jgi:hypothetical protein
VDDGIFAVFRSSVYCRDALDSLVNLVFWSGVSIRAAIQAWRNMHSCATAKQLKLASSENLDVDRRAVCSALSLFICLLEVLVGGVLGDMFTCRDCEYFDETGQKRVRAIVVCNTHTCPVHS